MTEKKITAEEFYRELSERFRRLLEEKGMLAEQVEITTTAMSPQEAIGVTKRKDFPILTGKDVMIQAVCGGAKGQAFTDAPVAFKGTLADVCALDTAEESHSRGIFIASLNAVMKYLNLLDCTVHCRNDGPELCAVDIDAYVRSHYGNPKIGQFGFQPAMLEKLSGGFTVRVADLNPANIGTDRYGVTVEDGGDDAVREDICEWADLILCTGSTVCNGTIVNFLPWADKVLFYGTTLAGAAKLMNLNRLCFADRYC